MADLLWKRLHSRPGAEFLPPAANPVVMRLRACMTLLFVVVASGIAAGAPITDRRAFALEVLKRWAPDGFAVVDAYESTPWSYRLATRSITMSRGDFMPFVRGTTPLEIVSSLVTVVHETSHNYARKMPWYMYEKRHEDWRDALAIMVAPQRVFLVPLTPTFPAREIAGLVPAAFRDHRYETYIVSRSDSQTTQQSGVYGLLDELNAYQQGTRAGVDLEGWYATQGTAAAWLAWMQGVEPMISARAQFKLFILAWLGRARAAHPEAWRAFVANRQAVRAFLQTDAAFEQTIARYRAARERLLARLRQQGATVVVEGGFIRIGDRGIGTADREYAALVSELSKPAYRDVEAALRAAADR